MKINLDVHGINGNSIIIDEILLYKELFLGNMVFGADSEWCNKAYLHFPNLGTLLNRQFVSIYEVDEDYWESSMKRTKKIPKGLQSLDDGYGNDFVKINKYCLVEDCGEEYYFYLISLSNGYYTATLYFEEIVDPGTGLTDFDIIILTGESGSGKTFLSKEFEHEFKIYDDFLDSFNNYDKINEDLNNGIKVLINDPRLLSYDVRNDVWKKLNIDQYRSLYMVIQ